MVLFHKMKHYDSVVKVKGSVNLLYWVCEKSRTHRPHRYWDVVLSQHLPDVWGFGISFQKHASLRYCKHWIMDL